MRGSCCFTGAYLPAATANQMSRVSFMLSLCFLRISGIRCMILFISGDFYLVDETKDFTSPYLDLQEA